MGKTTDITGMTFDCLTAIRPTNQKKNGYTIWECRCDCGRPDCRHIVYRPSRLLKSNKHNDCGCQKRRSPSFVDLTGRRFGLLTVLRESGRDERGHVMWLCQCDCGNTVEAVSSQLTKGFRISCGCQRNTYEELDLVGKRFGQLTVIAHESYTNGYHFWKCRCDCGKETTVRQTGLLSGHVKSCGCLAEDNFKKAHILYEGTNITSIRGKAGERKAFKNSKSGIRGVYQNSHGRWIATIAFRGKTIYLGSFGTPEEARKSREDAERELFDKTIEKWKQSGK